MIVLAIDTETTGTIDARLPLSDPSQPHIVQFAAALYDEGRVERASVSVICNPGVPIPIGASRVHGITDDVAARLGVPEKHAVGAFMRLSDVADVVVCFNERFDIQVTEIAAMRSRVQLGRKPVRCAMTEAVGIMKLPPPERMVAAGFGDKFKTPNLSEAYRHFVGAELEGAHDAMVDVRACAKVYFALLDLGCWKEAA